MTNQAAPSVMPYIGSKISLVTNSDLRYEGTLVNINTAQSTVTLRDVRMSGSNAHGQFVMPTTEVFDFIVFNGKDIKDLTVSEPGTLSVREDPAVVAVNVAPPHYDQRQYRNGPNNGYSPMGRGNNFQYDGYYQRNNRGSRGGVVGELTAQPNNTLKRELADAYNFDEANDKFLKEAEETRKQVEETGPSYNKEQSFFDSISCEAASRRAGQNSRVDREKQRERDTETFGAAAAQTLARYSRRPFKRGNHPRTGGRGLRGGYYGLPMHA